MLVAIIAGRESDLTTVEGATAIFDNLSIPYKISVISDHHCTGEIVKFLRDIECKGFEVIITTSVKDSNLASVIASNTSVPVIGIPVETKELGGMDSLISLLQMPKNTPVATMVIGSQGAVNAANLAVRILGNKYPAIRRKANENLRSTQTESISRYDQFRDLGFHNYIGQFLS